MFCALTTTPRAMLPVRLDAGHARAVALEAGTVHVFAQHRARTASRAHIGDSVRYASA
jgi:hypothetical protein